MVKPEVVPKLQLTHIGYLELLSWARVQCGKMGMAFFILVLYADQPHAASIIIYIPLENYPGLQRVSHCMQIVLYIIYMVLSETKISSS